MVGDPRASQQQSVSSEQTLLALIGTGSYPLHEYESYVRTVGAFYSIRYVHLKGSLRLLDKLVGGPHDEEFLIVEAGMRRGENVLGTGLRRTASLF